MGCLWRLWSDRGDWHFLQAVNYSGTCYTSHPKILIFGFILQTKSDWWPKPKMIFQCLIARSAGTTQNPRKTCKPTEINNKFWIQEQLSPSVQHNSIQSNSFNKQQMKTASSSTFSSFTHQLVINIILMTLHISNCGQVHQLWGGGEV
jgi:hypothetical protein